MAPDRLIGAILLCGIGLWFCITQQTGFALGGNDGAYPNKGLIHVNAKGLDAVAIGCFAIALGIINAALGIRDRRRIPVFWTGAALFVTTIVYGIVQLIRSL